MAIAPRSRPAILSMAIVVVMAIFADHDGHHSRCLGGHHQARSVTPLTSFLALARANATAYDCDENENR